MKRANKITLLIVLLIAVTSCSRKKNSWMSRNYHAVTAEYNAMYNGQVAFDQGKADLALSYRDNFWEILPVERFDAKEEEAHTL